MTTTRTGDHEPREAYAFDALIEMATRTRNGDGGDEDSSVEDGQKWPRPPRPT